VTEPELLTASEALQAIRRRELGVAELTGALLERIARIQPQVEKLHLFQRTPPWVLPHRDRPVRGVARALYRTVPGWQRLVRHADLLINATPLGRREEMPLRPGFLPPRGAVIDLVYVPGGTPLVRRVRALGIRCADGWSVLLAQGAAAFQAWTGRPAPIEAMREALPG